VLPQTKKDRGTPTENMTAKERALYRRLWMYRNRLVPVVVRGEFQASSTARFGHLGAFKYRIILYKVLEIGRPDRVAQRWAQLALLCGSSSESDEGK